MTKQNAIKPGSQAQGINILLRLFLSWIIFSLIGVGTAWAADLRVMTTGLGEGTVTNTTVGINCSSGSPAAACNATGLSGNVTLTVTPGTEFVFEPGCASTSGNSCVVDMANDRSIRVKFNLSTVSDRDLTPAEIADPDMLNSFLAARTQINTPARFLSVLPDEYKQNWIMMTRSESLQTGVASMPRFLLPSADGKFVFTFGLTESVHFPSSHPNAVEFMQWDSVDKNFRFHEIVLANVGEMNFLETNDGGSIVLGDPAVEARSRQVFIDDQKCTKCHSTQNILTPSPKDTAPTSSSRVGTSTPIGVVTPFRVKAKNKPNWDPYDSWAGMTPFNRDRIYEASIEAAAFRKLHNPWTWREEPEIRRFIEQLDLQPTGIGDVDRISRDESGGADDGEITFKFDETPEGIPAGTRTTNYRFDGNVGSGTATDIHQGGTRGSQFVVLQHSVRPGNDEGRGVVFFDMLGGFRGSELNQQRIADEILNHHYVTGSHLFDPRPLALAVAKGCFRYDTASAQVTGSDGQAISRLDFFNARYNTDASIAGGFAGLRADTEARAESLPLVKAGLQKRNLDRMDDIYLKRHKITRDLISELGLIREYGTGTADGTARDNERLRKEVFRRPLKIVEGDIILEEFDGDETVMRDLTVAELDEQGIYVDREEDAFNYETPNAARRGFVPLYRYFLEPLGISVDKWSTGVRGRSRTYTFADVFSLGNYNGIISRDLERSITGRDIGADARPGIAEFSGGAPTTCGALIAHLNQDSDDTIPAPAGSLHTLPDNYTIPKFTDVQRIINKACIECHGGLDIPPFKNRGTLNLAETEVPATGDDRLSQSFNRFSGLTTATDPDDTTIMRVITSGLSFLTNCPDGVMPCEGPTLSQTDIETIRRWITGVAGDPSTARANSRGDPHIATVDGVNYDFQAAGEYTLLRGQGLELQARQTPVTTQGTIYDDHTDLRSCVSINTAIAMKVGRHHITYQPSGRGDEPETRLELRIDGKLVQIGGGTTNLSQGVRVRTPKSGAIYVDTPGGGSISVQPHHWPHHNVWYMHVDTRRLRASQGLMGEISPGNWLPALPDSRTLGARPTSAIARYATLYNNFGNAWRVSDETSLFNYPPGISTVNYTIPSWPLGHEPSGCDVPPWDVFDEFREGPAIETIAPRTPAPVPIELEDAERFCESVIEPKARRNCIADVAVTGEQSFAAAYVASETYSLNLRPMSPKLIFPLDRYTDNTPISPPVKFKWETSEDANANGLIYRLCVWEFETERNFNKCTEIAHAGGPGTIVLPGGITVDWKAGLWLAGIVAIIGFLIFLLCVFVVFRRRYRWLAFIALLILLAILWAFYLAGIHKGGSSGVIVSERNLESGKEYYWSVIVEDADGGVVHSQSRRFEVE